MSLVAGKIEKHSKWVGLAVLRFCSANGGDLGLGCLTIGAFCSWMVAEGL